MRAANPRIYSRVVDARIIAKVHVCKITILKGILQLFRK